jgi:hypothetical protein
MKPKRHLLEQPEPPKLEQHKTRRLERVRQVAVGLQETVAIDSIGLSMTMISKLVPETP